METSIEIDYHLISNALDYYKFQGYKEIPVPWVVSPETTKLTLPPQGKAFALPIGDLVGSGEQSFLELARTQGLAGKYVCCTPCFRHEEKFGKYTFPYFVKVELMVIGPDVGQSDVLSMAHDALYFMNQHQKCGIVVQKDAENIWDIVSLMPNHMGVELGSYGRRWRSGLSWAYGTGLAEPRFSICAKGD